MIHPISYWSPVMIIGLAFLKCSFSVGLSSIKIKTTKQIDFNIAPIFLIYLSVAGEAMKNLIKLIANVFVSSPKEVLVREADKKYKVDLNLEQRISSRINRKAIVMIEARNGGNLYYATMYNFSGDGMYCGSDFFLKPGTVITIRLDNQPYVSAPQIYIGEILRCEQLDGADNSHLYGLGIKIIRAIYG
jgi:hypothetical protein